MENTKHQPKNSEKRKAYKQKCKRNKRIKKREAQNEENVTNVEQQQQLQHDAVAPSPAAASTAGPVPYPVMLGSDPGTNPVLLSEAMEWSENFSPDGIPYYYNIKSSYSVWEKPQALRDYEVARLATAAARVHPTPTIPVAQPVQKTNSNARIIYPSITAKNVEQQLQQGAVAPSPAAASTAGPVPYPVMLGSDPGTNPVLLSEAMEWSENFSPDGIPYYYNIKSSYSVWEKPQALRDYEVARLATAAARVHPTPTIPVAQPVQKTNSNARIIYPSITAKNVEQQQQPTVTFDANPAEVDRPSNIQVEEISRHINLLDRHQRRHDNRDSSFGSSFRRKHSTRSPSTGKAGGTASSVPVDRYVDANSVRAYGPGLEPNNCRANIPRRFKIDATKSGKAPLAVDIRSDKGPLAQKPEIIDHGDGTYDVTYMPPPENSTCKVRVTYGGKDIPKSPFEMKVQPTVEPKNVKVTGPGVSSKGIPASIPADFVVDTTEAGYGDLQVQVLGPDGYPRKVKVSDNGDGTFKATYTPDDLGQYKVNVKYGGKEVSHAPFNVQAHPTGKAESCKITEGIQQTLSIGEEYCISVNAKNAGNGAVTCRIRGTSGSDMDIDIDDNGDGTFSVYYTVKDAGEYTLSIKFGGNPIPDGV